MNTILRNRLFKGRLFILFFLTAFIGSAQGLEDFTNSTAGSSYGDGSFTGNNGVVWSFVASRDGNGDANNSGIDLPALMLRRVADGSKVTSSSIPGGIGNFSVKLYKGFTGSGDRQVELFVNGASKGVSTPFDDFNEHIFTVNNIDISGSIIIEIRNITSRQVIVDDISWTAFGGGGGNTAPIITNIIQTPASTAVTSSDAVSVSADLVDSDGIANAELHWGTVSGSLGNTIAMGLDAGNTYVVNSLIPAQANGTTVYYEITATDANGTPLSTTSPEQSYTVSDPVPFGLPYANGFRLQADYDEAVSYGFEFNNTVYGGSGGGGYTRINTGGSIVTPAINFSLYDRLLVNFDLSTYGGNTNQELTVFVSNDNGANYTALDSFIVPSAYITFEQFINVSTLNSTHGRIKFEMTGGTNAIRFRDFNIQEFVGYFYSNDNWTPFDPSGVSTSADDLYIADGTATFTTDIIARNLTINSGATVEVEKILTLAGNINNNGELIFISTPTGDGELAPMAASATINGNTTVQRYMGVNRAYRMVSSPVTTSTSVHDNWQEGATSNTDNPHPGFGTHITGTLVDQTDGFDATATGNPSMFTVDVDAQVFVPIDNTDVNTLAAGNPYLLFVRGDRDIDLTNDFSASQTVLRTTGLLFKGSQTQTYTGAEAGEFIMFGNPYQSTVDVTQVFANNTATNNINPNYYYVYDPTLGTHGAYVTVDLTVGDGTNIAGSDANKYLQPGQAAQVATLAAGAATILFEENDKAPGNFTATNRNNNVLLTDNMLVGKLYTEDNFNNGGPVHDSFGILFSQDNTNAVNSADAVKPMNFFENIGVENQGTILSIENREMPSIDETFQLYTTGFQNSNYVLKLVVDGLDENNLYLVDDFTGDSTLLEIGETAYSFSVDTTDPLSMASDRFSIRAELRLGVNNNSDMANVRLYPNPLSGNTFYINAPKLNGKNLSVNITDLSGRKIFEDTLECLANTVTVPVNETLASGIYIVTLKDGSEEKSFRLIKK